MGTIRLTRWSLALLLAATSPASAGERMHVVEVGGRTIQVKITESIDDVSMLRAECIIPRPHKVVWTVLSDYDNLEHVIPVVSESRLEGYEDGQKILYQEGSAGLWFLKRGFTVRFHVKEVPMAFIGFDAFEGDFKRFKGSWQVEARGQSTWVAHRVEIQPRFFAPSWAIRRVANDLMTKTIAGVIARCLSRDTIQ